MSDKMQKELKEIFFNNPDLLDKVTKSKDFEEACKLLKSYIHITPDSLKKIFHSELKTDSKLAELNDSELSNVSGGFSFKAAGDLIGAEIKHWFKKR